MLFSYFTPIFAIAYFSKQLVRNMAAKIHIKNDRINSFGGIFRQPWAHLRGLEAPAGGRRGYLRILGFEKNHFFTLQHLHLHILNLFPVPRIDDVQGAVEFDDVREGVLACRICVLADMHPAVLTEEEVDALERHFLK